MTGARRPVLPALAVGAALVLAPLGCAVDDPFRLPAAWAKNGDDDRSGSNSGRDDDGGRDDDDRDNSGPGSAGDGRDDDENDNDDDDPDDRLDNSGPGSADSGRGRGRGRGRDGDDAPAPDRTAPPPADRPSLAERREHDRFVRDEVLVLDAAPGFADAASGLGFRVMDQRPLGGLGLTVTRLRLPPGIGLTGAEAMLRRFFPDLMFDVNSLYRPQQAFSLPPPDYARTLVGWDGVALGCGGDLVIGMVDTGVDASHPAFAGRDIAQRSFGDGAVGAHGTAVASILVGAAGPAGLLPGARLKVAAAFAEDDEDGLQANAFDIAAALDWLIRAGARTVNLSLAGGPNRLLDLVFDRAAGQGVVAVAAAGNGGPGGPAAYPAAHPAVIAATAVDHRRVVYDGASRGGYVDMAAPGVRVAAAGPGAGWEFQTGTSFAAPFVTAAAALRRAARAGAERPADVGSVRRDLARSAIDLGPPGRDDAYGDGLIQAAALCD